MPRRSRIIMIVAFLNLVLFDVAWALDGFSEEGVRMVVRQTAKGAMLLFVAAFSASSLHALTRSAATRWMLKNRRFLGLSFALTHLVHLGSLVVLGVWFPEPFVAGLNATTLVGGGLAYVFVVLMAATSWDGAVQWMGARRWRLLHTIGGYYIWLIFFQSYLPRAMEDAFYVPFAGLLFASVGVRAARRWAARRGTGITAPA